MNFSFYVDTMFYFVLILTTIVRLGYSDELIRKKLPINSSFNSIEINGIFEVFLEPIDSISSRSVELETTVEGHEKIVVETGPNGILRIYVNGSVKLPRSAQVYIRHDEPLRRLSISGVSTVLTTKKPIYRTNEFLVEIRGSSRTKLEIECEKLVVSAFDASQVQIFGRAVQYALYRATGGSNIDGWKLLTNQVAAQASGISSIYFVADDDAAIEVNGISTVGYRLSTGRQASRVFSSGLSNVVLL